MAKSRQFSIEPGESNRDTRSQHDKFIEIARELGADEDEAAFKAQLAVIAQQKPMATPAPEKPRKRKAG